MSRHNGEDNAVRDTLNRVIFVAFQGTQAGAFEVLMCVPLLVKAPSDGSQVQQELIKITVLTIFRISFVVRSVVHIIESFQTAGTLTVRIHLVRVVRLFLVREEFSRYHSPEYLK